MDAEEITRIMDQLTTTFVEDESWDEDVAAAARHAVDALGELTEELTGVEYVSGAWDDEDEDEE